MASPVTNSSFEDNHLRLSIDSNLSLDSQGVDDLKAEKSRLQSVVKKWKSRKDNGQALAIAGFTMAAVVGVTAFLASPPGWFVLAGIVATVALGTIGAGIYLFAEKQHENASRKLDEYTQQNQSKIEIAEQEKMADELHQISMKAKKAESEKDEVFCVMAAIWPSNVPLPSAKDILAYEKANQNTEDRKEQIGPLVRFLRIALANQKKIVEKREEFRQKYPLFEGRTNEEASKQNAKLQNEIFDRLEKKGIEDSTGKMMTMTNLSGLYECIQGLSCSDEESDKIKEHFFNKGTSAAIIHTDVEKVLNGIRFPS